MPMSAADPSLPPGAALAAALIALLGPMAGEYTVIVLAALAGAMWPLSARPPAGRLDAALFVLRLVATATALGGLCAWLLQTHLGVPSQYAPAVAAWAIGAVGDGWRDLIRLGLDRLRGVAGGPQA